MTYFTIKQIKAANKKAGDHFFDAGTMRWFNSRIIPRVYGQGIFVTTEADPPHIPRHASVRYAGPKGSILTLALKPTFLELNWSAGRAKKAAEKIAKAGFSYDECRSLKNLYW